MSTPLFPLTPALLATVVARPETFLTIYAALGGGTDPAAYVRSQLGAPFASLADAGCLTTFASVIAYNAAPAGAATLDPRTATLQQLLTAPALASLHFCRLTALLALLGSPGLVPPDAPPTSPQKPTVHFVIWHGAAALDSGTHTQLVVSNVLDAAYLLLDPQYAFAQRIPFTGSGPQASMSFADNVALMLQTPMPQENLVVLDPAPTSAAPQVLQAMVSGSLGPADLVPGESDSWDGLVGRVVADMG